jgi:putative ABC transport system ATP-binding protein
MKKKVVDIRNITKMYQMGEIQVHALRGLTMWVEPGEVVSIMGPSGSGKSTLMNIMGCLDRPSSGDYLLDGEAVKTMDDDQLAAIRNRKVGFIFQNYNLLSRASALDNVVLPLRYQLDGNGDAAQKATKLLITVGLKERIHHKPSELSGGEQQRVAIARALVNQPAIVLADEPTGNLDSKTGAEIIELLLGLNQERHVTLIIVTHDSRIAKRTGRTIEILDGKVKA